MKIIRYQAYEDSDQAYSSIIVQKPGKARH